MLERTACTHTPRRLSLFPFRLSPRAPPTRPSSLTHRRAAARRVVATPAVIGRDREVARANAMML